MKTALVLGCSGLIGSHMVNRLKQEGYWVRGVDIREPEFHVDQSDDFVLGDLRDKNFVSLVMFAPDQKSMEYGGFDEVYQLAADMGGAGYIFTGDHDADVMHNSALINLNVCFSAAKNSKVFYSSSACIYPREIQQESNNTGLKESSAWPANPDSDYGVEKIFSERLYLAYHRNYGMDIRIARFHNVYGPNSPFDNIRAKAPAAICRKVLKQDTVSADYIESWNGDRLDGVIEIWGDGEQTRSFLYIEDCIDAVRLLMQSDFKEPINIGSEEMVTVNQLADIAIELSGKKIEKYYDLTKPQGVRGRNSNNDLIREKLGWEPKYTLRQGLEITYKWINEQINGK